MEVAAPRESRELELHSVQAEAGPAQEAMNDARATGKSTAPSS